MFFFELPSRSLRLESDNVERRASQVTTTKAWSRRQER